MGFIATRCSGGQGLTLTGEERPVVASDVSRMEAPLLMYRARENGWRSGGLSERRRAVGLPAKLHNAELGTGAGEEINVSSESQNKTSFPFDPEGGKD